MRLVILGNALIFVCINIEYEYVYIYIYVCIHTFFFRLFRPIHVIKWLHAVLTDILTGGKWSVALDNKHRRIAFNMRHGWGGKVCFITKSFRYLKWRVSSTLQGYSGGWGFPYISRIHTAYTGEYLHFRYLKCLVTLEMNNQRCEYNQRSSQKML